MSKTKESKGKKEEPKEEKKEVKKVEAKVEEKHEEEKKKEFDIMLREDIKSEEDVLDYAKASYAKMQSSWWEFAKSIYMIRESKAYECKYSSFSQYCEKEFPSISMPVITKFIAIVDKWHGIIETRFKKDEAYSLPSYESCYTVITAEKREVVDREEISRLKKAVLDGKISYVHLRDKIKELIEMKRKESKTSMEELEKELEKEIIDDGDVTDLSETDYSEMPSDAEELFDSPDDEEEDEDIPSDVEEDVEEEIDGAIEEEPSIDKHSIAKKVKVVHDRVKAINDDVVGFTSALKKKDINKQVIALGQELEKTLDIVDEFLTKLEEVTK